jgi:hypothetical protein
MPECTPTKHNNKKKIDQIDYRLKFKKEAIKLLEKNTGKCLKRWDWAKVFFFFYKTSKEQATEP